MSLQGENQRTVEILEERYNSSQNENDILQARVNDYMMQLQEI